MMLSQPEHRNWDPALSLEAEYMDPLHARPPLHLASVRTPEERRMSNQVSPEQEPTKPGKVGVGGKQELGSGRWEHLPGEPEGTSSPDVGAWS